LDRWSAASVVDQALFGAGLPAERLPAAVKLPSFVIPTLESPEWVVRVCDAVFFDDEAAQAVDLLSARLEGGATVRQVLVVAGYASPDVLDQLRAAASEVLVADDPDGFALRMALVADRIASAFALGRAALAALEKRELSRQ